MIVYETIGATQDSLRCCIKGNCADCHFKPRSTDCIHRLLSAALSVLHRQENRINHLKELSNSQQAEIERLKNALSADFLFAPQRADGKSFYKRRVIEFRVNLIREKVIEDFVAGLKAKWGLQDCDMWFEITEHGLIREIDDYVEEYMANFESEENNNA